MQIMRGRQDTAVKCVLYGPEGIGKSTFAAQFPGVVFLDTEGSTKYMDVARAPKPTSWSMLLEEVAYFREHTEELKTLALDTADWAERLCSDGVCAKEGKSSIESFGYGKGYTYLGEEFGKLLNLLEEVVERGVNVVVTAHAKMRKFEQPDEMSPYDRWELKLSKTTAPLLKEWADLLLFANYETVTVKRDDGKVKAQGGKRVMYTSHHPCWDAKNRFGLPEKLPFSYESITHCIPTREEIPVQPHELEPKPNATMPELRAPAKDPIAADKDYLKPLYDLMGETGTLEEEIRHVVAQKGYFPEDMPIEDYPEDFVSGVLVGAWNQVYALVDEARPLPF